MASKGISLLVLLLSYSIAAGKPSLTKQLEFALGNPYGSSMVLQRSPSSAVIWGYGTAGASVSVQVGAASATTTVNENDGWQVTLPPTEAGGPFTLTAVQNTGGVETTITLDDVLFGDVWICSGQSNMEMAMGSIYNATEEIQSSLGYSQIRLFQVQNTISETPLADFMGISKPWTLPTEESLGLGQGWNGFSALCFMYGRHLFNQFQVPIGLVDTTWGGTPVEAWSSTEALAQCTISKQSPKSSEPKIDAGTPTALYNAMISPFTRTSVKGAIWYQGEANVGNPNYACMFPAMIRDWRAKWNAGTQGSTDPNFPFGFVQLATNTYTEGDAWPWLRWAQTADQGYVPNLLMVNVFMAVAMDLPDDNTPDEAIHPRDKQTIAYRLAIAGFNVAYGLTENPTAGPTYTVIYINRNTNTAVIGYDKALQQRNTNGFFVNCGAGWVDVPMSVDLSTNTVNVDFSSCPGATQLAYEWRETPCPYKQCALYSNDQYELPSPPWVWNI